MSPSHLRLAAVADGRLLIGSGDGGLERGGHGLAFMEASTWSTEMPRNCG
jgi:hypothetical protein